VSEADLKRAVVEALTWELRGKGRVLRLNAGKLVLRDATGKRRLLAGVEAGTPDLLVMLPEGATQWIELKAPTGRVTTIQRQWHDHASVLGHRVAVCRSIQDAIDAVRGRS
jgi:hypothetical protein